MLTHLRKWRWWWLHSSNHHTFNVQCLNGKTEKFLFGSNVYGVFDAIISFVFCCENQFRFVVVVVGGIVATVTLALHKMISCVFSFIVFQRAVRFALDFSCSFFYFIFFIFFCILVFFLFSFLVSIRVTIFYWLFYVILLYYYVCALCCVSARHRQNMEEWNKRICYEPNERRNNINERILDWNVIVLLLLLLFG